MYAAYLLFVLIQPRGCYIPIQVVVEHVCKEPTRLHFSARWGTPRSNRLHDIVSLAPTTQTVCCTRRRHRCGVVDLLIVIVAFIAGRCVVARQQRTSVRSDAMLDGVRAGTP